MLSHIGSSFRQGVSNGLDNPARSAPSLPPPRSLPPPYE